jgi:integrase
VLSELKQPEYELALLVATCGLRISEALGLKWRDILFDKGLIAIRQTFVHLSIQPGAKTKLSRSRVEAPKLLLDVLSAWRRETRYADENDFVFPSEKLRGKQPRSGSQLVEDYLRPPAMRAGVIRKQNGITYGPDGEVVKRFGFHTFRHSLATCMMDEQENPAVVQAIMRHSKMDMTLYYSHSRRSAKRAAQEKVLRRLVIPAVAREMRVRMRGARDDSVRIQWIGNLCIMMNLPRKCGRLTQR